MDNYQQILTPKLGANDDEVKLTELFCRNGDKVNKGDLVCSVESTKASIDVEAESSGFIFYLAELDDMCATGSVLAVIADTESFDLAKLKTDLAPAEAEVRITKKARRLADKYGVSLEDLLTSGIVREKDVQAYIEKHKKADTQASGARIRLKRPKLVLLGAGLQSPDVVELINLLGTYEIAGLLDSNYPSLKERLGVPVIGDVDKLVDLKKEGIDSVAMCFGWVVNVDKRVETAMRCIEAGLNFPTFIHPSAQVSPSAVIEPGCIILANTTIGAEAHLGYGVIVNNNAVVSHTCRIGDFSCICPGAMVGGSVTTGEQCVIGMNASIFYKLSISAGTVVYNNTSVTADI